MANFEKIAVVIVYVSDLKKSKAFYSDSLGLGTPAVDTEEWVEFALNSGSNLALHLSNANLISNTESNIKFSLQVADLETTARELKDKGVNFVTDPTEIANFKYAEFVDPEGNVIRLNQFS